MNNLTVDNLTKSFSESHDFGSSNLNNINSIISESSNVLQEQQKILGEQAQQLSLKRQRNEIQLNAINAKKDIINTRARMLQIAQENNIYKQKIIYTLISFIFAVFIAILVIYVYFSKA